MSTPGRPAPVDIKPSRTWYAIAAAVFVGSLIPAFFLARDGMQTFDLSVHSISGNTIKVQDEQLSVFAPDHLALPEPISCTVKSSADGRPIPLDSTFADLTIDGRERVGMTPEDLPAGTYQLRCIDDSGTIPVGDFGVTSTEGWTAAVLKIVAAVVIPGIAGLTAITIAIITAVRRSSARRRALQAQYPAAPPGYPPPPPGYPPPGYPPPPPPAR